MYFIAFVKVYTNVLIRPANLRLCLSVCLSIFLFRTIYFIKLSKRCECISLLLWKLIQMCLHDQRTSDHVCLFVCLYLCFAQFTLLVYKSLIMVVENCQKYHWIQHTNTQPVVITRKWNKLLWTSEASESLFNWHIHFICIQIFNNRRRKFPKIPLDSA